MPLDVRSISIRFAAAAFFILSFIGWFAELPPLTCCKRAGAGALIIYITTAAAVNLVNRMLIGLWIKSQSDEHKGDLDGRGF
ncbi:MAG: hypothetical protein KBI46_00340 [Phycisphaerae bacterium]|nr:hypothetical protein [Phycisphaerae bacterium]